MINILGVAKDIRPCPRCGCYTMEYRSMGPHIGKYCKKRLVHRTKLSRIFVWRRKKDYGSIYNICNMYV